MPELRVIGQVENPEELDFEPLVVPLAGYTVDHEEVIERFRFRPVRPAGAALNVMRSTDAQGNVGLGPVVGYLDKCLLEEDAERWQAFLDRDDLMIEQDVLFELYREVSAWYAGRPTRRPSDSSGGGKVTPQTSRVAARSAASTSKRKRSSPRSTSSTP